MRARTVALAALGAVAVAGLVWWRRRTPAPADLLVQFGVRDGAVRTLDLFDPATAELETLAAGVRDSLTGGA
jgi:hypothetical protein